MRTIRSKGVLYGAFIGLVTVILVLTKPTPDLITLSYTSLSATYGGLLTALGGFSITVLAVLLGLEALDSDKAEPAVRIAHGAAVRHVSLSLAVACISCFVGANLMGEVSAQAAAIDSRREAVVSQVSLELESTGLPRPKIAEALALMRSPESPDRFFGADGTSAKILALLDSSKGAKAPAAMLYRKTAEHLDEVLGSSGRRLFMVASVCAYLASFVILQSLAFLLRIRFPQTTSFTGFQNYAVLSIGGLLLIKLVHTASYGLEDTAFLVSRAIGAGLMVVGVLIYGSKMRMAIKRLRTEPAGIERFTPLAPYYAVLTTAVVSAFHLAATFSEYGQPTLLDRAVVIGGAFLCTGFLLVIQLEQPTIELLGAE